MDKELGEGHIFFQHLANRREALGLSRRQAAQKLECSRTYLGNIENCAEIPSYNFLIKLAKAYNEEPLPFLIWRAQLKGEYDMHQWLREIQGRLRRENEIPTPSELAADKPAEYHSKG